MPSRINPHLVANILLLAGLPDDPGFVDLVFSLVCKRSESKSDSSSCYSVSKEVFSECVTSALSLSFPCFSSLSAVTLPIAWDLAERRRSITILLGGTSGCGKSTLALQLAKRLGISTVLSSDNVRHLIRNFHSKDDSPILWASSYYAGECVPHGLANNINPDPVIAGFELQNNIVYPELEKIISAFECRNESLIVEGVHLSAQAINRLLRSNRSCLPFIVFIKSRSVHSDRFSCRGRPSTSSENRYLKYLDNIRTIQRYLLDGASSFDIPVIENSNIEHSVKIIHQSLLSVLVQENFIDSSLSADLLVRSKLDHEINCVSDHGLSV